MAQAPHPPSGLRLAPALKSTALVGAVQYYDAKVDDARHTMEIARTAATYGAHVASRVAVVGFLRQGERVTGVRALDKETGREFEIHARQVVNATGVWTDQTQAMVGERGQFHVRASKGIHLVVPRDRFHSTTGIILRTEKSVLFVIPWGRHWIIGTTDTDWALDLAHPQPPPADIEYILGHVNRILATELTQADVEGVYAGLRPLLSGESDQTSKLSREHIVAHPTRGWSSSLVASTRPTGSWPWTRSTRPPAPSVATFPSSTTENIPMVGAVGYHAMWNRRKSLAADSGLHVERIEKMLMRHGVLITEILDLIAADRTLGEPLPGGEDYLKGRDRLRRLARGRAAPRRRPRPPDPAVDRVLRPGPHRLSTGGRAHRARPRLVGGGCRQRGRALPPAGRRRADEPDHAGRRLRRRRPARRAGYHRVAAGGVQRCEVRL